LSKQYRLKDSDFIDSNSGIRILLTSGSPPVIRSLRIPASNKNADQPAHLFSTHQLGVGLPAYTLLRHTITTAQIAFIGY